MNGNVIYNIPNDDCAGIYAISNFLDCKFYIGQTTQLRTRALQHDNHLKNKNHPNKSLQDDCDKSLVFVVLHKLEEKEVNWLKIYESIYMFSSLHAGYKLYNNFPPGKDPMEYLSSKIAFDMIIDMGFLSKEKESLDDAILSSNALRFRLRSHENKVNCIKSIYGELGNDKIT